VIDVRDDREIADVFGVHGNREQGAGSREPG
jgi:hypothetical protein